MLKPVDNDATLLFVVLNPVDRLASRLTAVLSPVDVEVDRLAILLAVVLIPVLNCDTVAASCGAEPSATLVIRRNALGLPTDTSDSGAALPVR